MEKALYAYLLILLGLFIFVDFVRTAFKQGLRSIPGPFLARFSGLYRLSLVAKGKAPEEYLKVHQKYGQVVRVGPNHVSISDPAMIPTIYGIGSNYLKVRRISSCAMLHD